MSVFCNRFEYHFSVTLDMSAVSLEEFFSLAEEECEMLRKHYEYLFCTFNNEMTVAMEPEVTTKNFPSNLKFQISKNDKCCRWLHIWATLGKKDMVYTKILIVNDL